MPRSVRSPPPGGFSLSMKASTKVIFNPKSSQLSLGDIVRTNFSDGSQREGIIVDKLSDFKVKVDFGDIVKDVLIENCVLLIGVDEFEVGDKVEARPSGSNMYFVGHVIHLHDGGSMDVRMEGDDPDDIEYGIEADNCRKLMTRRQLVANRWKRAFMLVLAANFFQRIHFTNSEKYGSGAKTSGPQGGGGHTENISKTTSDDKAISGLEGSKTHHEYI